MGYCRRLNISQGEIEHIEDQTCTIAKVLDPEILVSFCVRYESVISCWDRIHFRGRLGRRVTSVLGKQNEDHLH